ncbi:MAG: neutral/alkaline non-lysosomal ceramidase N-terminal domain-containing protein [Chloroflexi bacterium]|nr:neutral/alkaline non-lysosomal ceramidase N-terminal domain-containing protein [Chloroflexota bacterium]
MLKAGTGRVDITPPIGIAHAGWGAATHERAEGVDMPFYVTALYVTDGATECVIVDIDILLLPSDLDGNLRQAVEHGTGISRANVWLSATHTHAAAEFPGTFLIGGADLIEPYMASLPSAVARAAAEAKSIARPVRVGTGSGSCAINVNRRPRTEKGFVFTGRNWDGFSDRQVLVVAIDDLDGGPVATLVNYACHPTILGPANRMLSPDYPGHMRRTVEMNVGGLCLFLQGAAGNQGPVVTFVGDIEAPRKLGRRLGLEAARVRMNIDPVPRKERLVEIVGSGADLGMYAGEPLGEPDDTLKVITRTVDLPAGDFPPVAEIEAEFDRLKADLQTAREKGAAAAVKAAVMAAKRSWIRRNLARMAQQDTIAVHIQAVRLGSTALVGVPAEPFAEIGVSVKEQSNAPHTVFCGYTNGLFAYVPTAQAYEEGGYEPRTTPFRAGADTQLVDACVRAVQDLWE